MFKPNQIIRLWNGAFDIIDSVEELQYEVGSGAPVALLHCRNGTWTDNDVAQIEGELNV